MYRNSKERIAQLQREKRLRPGKGGRPPHLDQDVDGCAGQYWSAKAAFLTALLARERKVIIKRHRSAPGEGKRKVDGTHATFKAEARERMAMREDVSGEAVKPEMVEQASRVEDEHCTLASKIYNVMTRDFCAGAPAEMNKKRQEDGKMGSRGFSLYVEGDIVHRKMGKFKPAKVPSAPEERKAKFPYLGWKGHFNLVCDPALPVCEEAGEERAEAMLRRWGCLCPPCRRQLQHPVLEERYKTPEECELKAVFCGLNDFKRVVLERKGGGGGEQDGEEGDGDGVESEEEESDDEGDGEEGDDGDDGAAPVIVDRSELLAMHILPSDNLLFDASSRATDAAGHKDIGRYYCARATEPMQILAEDEESDWGTLPAGIKVVPAVYYNLVNKPDYAACRAYTLSSPPINVKVPVEHIAHACFEMEELSAAPGGSKAPKWRAEAMRKGGVVLSEADHSGPGWPPVALNGPRFPEIPRDSPRFPGDLSGSVVAF